MDNIEQRFYVRESRLNRMDSEFADRTATLLDGLLALSQQTTAIANRMDQLTAAVAQLAQNAESDRMEFRRIWEYLESQQRHQGNGHG
ncbi:hypothetical protein BCD67_00475 [Oscillatoriales cyanobacterium USR001]|nr:hypothetical protein BCD67_00475 [Oscillatoriales cyanobacterium USR001]